jgi:predicted flap endonuclease-1-like 5' DNA nuclease
MPAFTTNQWVVVFLVLVLGWLLGLISRSSGAKWRRAYEAERDARIDEQRTYAAELETANARIVELERARPVAAAPVAAAPLAAASTPHNLDLTRDDLSRIRGIGPVGEADLNEQGIYRYSDIANMTADEEAALEDRLGADRGYISQEGWRAQARLLADGKIDEHRATYG